MRPPPIPPLAVSHRFPRVSGDAPAKRLTHDGNQEFSPRERGCARLTERNENQPLVFPA